MTSLDSKELLPDLCLPCKKGQESEDIDTGQGGRGGGGGAESQDN